MGASGNRRADGNARIFLRKNFLGQPSEFVGRTPWEWLRKNFGSGSREGLYLGRTHWEWLRQNFGRDFQEGLGDFPWDVAATDAETVQSLATNSTTDVI